LGNLNPEYLRQLAKTREPRVERTPGRGLGFLDTAVSSHFRSLDDGTKVFYAQGAFGRRGYVVPPEAEPALRSRARNMAQATMLASAWLGITLAGTTGKLDAVGLCVLLAVLGAVGWVTTTLAYWPLTRGLERARVPNSPMAHWRSMGQTMHPILLALPMLLCVALLSAGLWIYHQDSAPLGLLIAVVAALFSAPYVIALKSRWLRRAQKSEER